MKSLISLNAFKGGYRVQLEVTEKLSHMCVYIITEMFQELIEGCKVNSEKNLRIFPVNPLLPPPPSVGAQDLT